MYAKELIKLLEKNGWCKVSQNGSHIIMEGFIYEKKINCLSCYIY